MTIVSGLIPNALHAPLDARRVTLSHLVTCRDRVTLNLITFKAESGPRPRTS